MQNIYIVILKKFDAFPFVCHTFIWAQFVDASGTLSILMIEPIVEQQINSN